MWVGSRGGEFHHGPSAVAASNGEISANGFRSLTHDGHAEVVLGLGGSEKAASVIDDPQDYSLLIDAIGDPQRSCARMSPHIRDGLLCDAKELGAHARRQTAAILVEDDMHSETGLGAHSVDIGRQRILDPDTGFSAKVENRQA